MIGVGWGNVGLYLLGVFQSRTPCTISTGTCAMSEYRGGREPATAGGGRRLVTGVVILPLSTETLFVLFRRLSCCTRGSFASRHPIVPCSFVRPGELRALSRYETSYLDPLRRATSGVESSNGSVTGSDIFSSSWDISRIGVGPPRVVDLRFDFTCAGGVDRLIVMRLGLSCLAFF